MLLKHGESVVVVLANSQPSNLQFVLKNDLDPKTKLAVSKTVKVQKDRKITIYFESGTGGRALQIMVGSLVAGIVSLLF